MHEPFRPVGTRLFVATDKAATIEAELRHSPTATLAAELAQLRTQAQLLYRSYGPCAYRTRELLRIERQHRLVREQLRAALGPAALTDTRARSQARVPASIAGL